MAETTPTPTLSLEGSLEITDQGQTIRRDVVITNTVGARILLLRAGKHTFDASELATAHRRKKPYISWSRWRNVLAPGQKAKIPIDIPRTPYGPRSVEMTVEYTVPSDAFGKAHIKNVVPEGADAPGRYRTSLARGQTQPLLVAMTGDADDAGLRRTVSKKWTLQISPPSGLPKSVAPDTLTAFRLDCPHFGALVKKDGIVSQVVGETLTPLGAGDLAAYEQLGALIAQEGRATLRSATLAVGISKAFETRREPNLPYATDQSPGHSMSGDWILFEVTAETLPSLWAALGPDEALRVEPFHGLAIVSNGFGAAPLFPPPPTRP